MEMTKTVKCAGIIFIALYVIILTVVPVSAQDTVTLAYNGDPEKLAPWKLVHLATYEMFRRLNIKLKYKVMPAQRASLEANKGYFDGDNARVYEYDKKFSNLLRVGESIYTQVLAAYVTDPLINIEGWDSLRNTEYKVEYIRGIIFVEINLLKTVPTKNLTSISRRELGLRKLAGGRTDVFVDVRGLIASLLKRKEFKNTKIRQAGVMETTPLYLYLHKKHAALIPKLKEALKQIKADGLYDNYRQQVFGKTG